MTDISKKNKMVNDPTRDPLFKWCLDNLLRESGYIEISQCPYYGGPYYFRRSDSTFWELDEQQRIPVDKSNPENSPCTIMLCFKKVAHIENCKILQESHNSSLGHFETNDRYSMYSWDSGSSGSWVPASSKDPRRFKFSSDAQTKAPFTLAISLKPEILQSCLDKKHYLNKEAKKKMRKERANVINQLVTMLGLKPLEKHPVELSRYSKKRKRRYYLLPNGGTGPDGTYPSVWYINYLDPSYSKSPTFYKLESYDELRDVCMVNNLDVPPRHYLQMQECILYSCS